MKKLLIAIMIFLSMYAHAQNVASKFDFRFGVGTSLLSSGDMRTVMFENELNYFINNFLSTSLSAGYGKSNSGVFESSSFVQGNLNVFISPFKNNNKNDFRIGTGISYMNVSDAYRESANYENGIIVDEDYIIDKRNTVGMNIILENTYTLREKFLIGVKLFTQPYNNGDINSGLLLKLGLKIQITPEYQYHFKARFRNVGVTFTSALIQKDIVTLKMAAINDEQAKFLRYGNATAVTNRV